jgi:gas vesicle protein
MENSKGTEKVVAALLIGAAIGGALGILLASDKGSALRKVIAGKAGDVSQLLKENFTSLVEASKKEFNGVKEKAMTLASNIKEN